MSLKTGIAAAFGAVGLKSPVSLSGELFDAIENNDAAEIEKIAKLQPALLGDIPAKGNGLPQTPGAAYILRALNDEKELAVATLARIAPQLLTGADDTGMTFPMYFAKNHQSPQIYKGLFAVLNKDHVDAADHDGNKLLHYAAMRAGDDGQNVKMTLPYTSKDANLPNISGETPLMLAAAYGTQSGVLYLQTVGHADVHATDFSGRNATMHAISHSNLGNATLLMNMGGVVDFTSPDIAPQQRIATYYGPFEFLQALQQTRERQENAEKTKQQVDDIGRQVQEALERKQNTADVVAVVKAGVVGDVTAPERAAFKKKTRSATPVLGRISLY